MKPCPLLDEDGLRHRQDVFKNLSFKKKFTTQNAGTEGRISASNGNVFLRYSKMTSVIKLQDQS